MNLYKIRGGTREEVEQKKYTIGVGISLGNKWFTPDNILELINWALVHSKKEVVIYIADSIHAINIMVRNRKTAQRAVKMARESADELFAQVQTNAKSLSLDEQARLTFVRWDELVDQKFLAKLEYLRAKYEESGLFQDTLHAIVRNHTAYEGRNFSDEDIHRLGSYIVEELPECMNRIPMKGIVVDAYVYPQDNEIVEMIERIQKGEILPEIKKNILDTEPKVFLEVR